MSRSFKLSVVVASASLLWVACGPVEARPEPSVSVATVEQGLSGLPLGADCSSNSQCASGLCVDLHTSQAYWPYCYGRICSTPCEGEQSGDSSCQQVAEDAGAPNPEAAYCTSFGWESYYACDLAAAGLGTVGCE